MARDDQGTYLLSNGQEVTDNQPHCYFYKTKFDQTHLPPFAEHDGIYAEVDDEEAPSHMNKAWLSYIGEQVMSAANSLHEFRDAVLAKYPTARFQSYYPKRDGVLIVRRTIVDDE